MNLLKELKASQNLVLAWGRGQYKQGLLSANKAIAEKYKSICYITLTKPVRSVMSDLRRQGIDLKKYRFIDCVSKKAGLKKARKTVFVSSPKSLTALGIAVSKALKKRKPKVLFFDSISSLLVYNSELDVVRFLHFLMIAVKGTKTKAVYPMLKNDLEKKLVREIELFSDKVIVQEPEPKQGLGQVAGKTARQAWQRPRLGQRPGLEQRPGLGQRPRLGQRAG